MLQKTGYNLYGKCDCSYYKIVISEFVCVWKTFHSSFDTENFEPRAQSKVTKRKAQ